MIQETTNTEPRHPIGVVMGRTGITADVLRAWERRYKAVIPRRTETGRRLYTDADIRKLLLLKNVVDAGRRISDVAHLEISELEDLVQEDRETAVEPAKRAKRSKAPEAKQLLSECLDALEVFDRGRFERALARATISLSPPILREELIVPLMNEIGERWHDGSLRVAQEHLATAVVRSHLRSVAESGLAGKNAPRIVVTTPAGQHHEIGALLAAAVANECGWEAFYLGPNLPAVEILGAVKECGARALALSAALGPEETGLHEELRALREFLDPDFPIFVGGSGAAADDPMLSEVGVIRLASLSELALELTSRHA